MQTRNRKKLIKGKSPQPPPQSSSIQMVDEAIRQAEVRIAKGKRPGQGIGSVRKPGGAGKKK